MTPLRIKDAAKSAASKCLEKVDYNYMNMSTAEIAEKEHERGYIAGATAEYEFTKKAMNLLTIMTARFEGAASMADGSYDRGLITRCNNLIAKWKKGVHD